jgi:RimJ/RimL family protein N-acetyltransferase
MRNAPQTIETRRLSLRWFTSQDADLMLAIWNDADFVRHVGDRGIRTIRETEAAMEAGMLRQYPTMGYGPYRVALTPDDTPIGICGLFQRDYLPVPDLGFCLLPDYRRRGFTEEASRAVLEMAKSELQLDRVAAIVADGNQASMALIRKLGGVEVPARRWNQDARGSEAEGTSDPGSHPTRSSDLTRTFEITLFKHC